MLESRSENELPRVAVVDLESLKRMTKGNRFDMFLAMHNTVSELVAENTVLLGPWKDRHTPERVQEVENYLGKD